MSNEKNHPRQIGGRFITTTFEHVKNPDPVNVRDWTWGEFVEFVLAAGHERVDEKEATYLFGNYKLKPDATSSNANVEAVYGWALDLDKLDQAAIDGVIEQLQVDGLAFLVYSTHSHSVAKPKLRVVGPLSRPVASNDWSPVWRAIVDRYCLEADEKCKDPRRLYYWPSAKPGAQVLLQEYRGRALDVDALDLQVSKQIVTQASARAVILASQTTRYGWAALESEIERVASAQSGDQEHTLNGAALKIGSLVGGGEIAEADARELLIEAGLAMVNSDPARPWTHDQVTAKVARGLRDGAQTPRSGTTAAELADIATIGPPKKSPLRVDRAPHTIIFDDAKEADAIDKAIDAVAANSADVYQRAGLLVHVAEDLAPPRIDRKRKNPRICEVRLARLRDELSKVAAWIKVVWTKNGEHEVTIPVPHKVCEGILARDAWRDVREIVGLSDCPILRSDGSIASERGYDTATGVYIADDVAIERPPGTPAQLADYLLTELVGDFPFASSAHRAAWLAAILTPIARHAFEGPSPLILIDKNVRGCGGSLLADLIGIVCTGRDLPRMSQETDEYQESNRLLGLAVSGDPVALIDNVNLPLGNGALDRALTGTAIQGRWLGGNKIVTAPWNCLLLATGNNIQLVGDTTRRALHVRLESPEEAPENRAGFRHADLKKWARENRGALLGAALEILSAYVRSSAPRPKPWGSFEGWSDVVRGAVIAAGLPDPVEGRAELVAIDGDAETLRGLLDGLTELGATSESKGLTVRDLLLKAQIGQPALENALKSIDEKLDARKVGEGFRKYRGRVLGGRRLVSGTHSHKKVASWFVTAA